MLTPDEVQRRVDLWWLTHNRDYDPETTHLSEDDLHIDVLRAIADGLTSDPAACAREVLKTVEKEYSRWYA